MNISIETSQLPGPAQRLLGDGAPKPARMMAARGVMPGLKPGHIVTVLAVLTSHEDQEVASTARATLAKLPPPMLNGALQTDLDGGVVHLLAENYATNHDVMASLLRQPSLRDETLAELAERADEKLGELVATNEQRMLRCPAVIEKLYMNSHVRMSTSDRLIELAVRNGLELKLAAFKEAAAAIQNELIPEPTEEPTFDDTVFEEAKQLAQRTQDKIGDGDAFAREEDEEGDETREHVVEDARPLFARIQDMTVSQKIRYAMLGNSAARLLLVRDKNRLVAEAAVKSPLMNENDAVRISSSRMVSEDVLRIIAMNRDLTRSYQVKLNLVQNPRTPFTFAMRLIPHLRDSDVRLLARSKQVPSQIRTAARRQISRKEGKH